MGARSVLTERDRRRALLYCLDTTPSHCCRSDLVYAVDEIGPTGFRGGRFGRSSLARPVGLARVAAPQAG